MFDGFSRIDFQPIYPGFLEAGKIYLLKVITSGRFSKITYIWRLYFQSEAV